MSAGVCPPSPPGEAATISTFIGTSRQLRPSLQPSAPGPGSLDINPFLQFDNARIKYQQKVFDSQYSVSGRRWWGKVSCDHCQCLGWWWLVSGGAQIVNTILVLFNCNIDPWPQSHKLHTAAPSSRLLKLTAQLGPVDHSRS